MWTSRCLGRYNAQVFNAKSHASWQPNFLNNLLYILTEIQFWDSSGQKKEKKHREKKQKNMVNGKRTNIESIEVIFIINYVP